MIIERLVLIAIAGALVAVVSFLFVKYRKLHGRKEAELGKEDVIGRLFLRKLMGLQATVGKEDPEQIFKRLNRMLKSFFSELYDIRYQFDYLELNEELGKKGVSEQIRNDVIELAMQMSQTEYGGEKITNITLHSLVDKSIRVVNRVTGQQPEPSYGKPPAEAPPAVKKALAKKELPPREKMKAAEKLPPAEVEKKEKAPPAEKPPVPAEEEKPPAEELPPEKKAPVMELPPPEKEEAAPEKNVEAVPEKKREAAPKVREEKAASAVKMVEEAGQGIVIPADEKGKIDKIRRGLVEAEQELRSKDYDNAMESYTELKALYDSLGPAVRVQMYDDIKRIISIYNTLLKEYKDTLLGSE
ncbi:MAG: hypothetical protein JXC85_02665 [Candidatus Aenigmarchaeota archaeon]|nr:hypothetical protein [Candidatus Aenigmarchaeota archaeon]